MGLIPRSNHLVLIRDCYPPAPSSSTSPSEPIPAPISNGLGKLSFYAVNRPKKLPKVIQVLLERATKDHGSSGIKARQDLGVTLEIMRGLVLECGESMKDGAGELVKAIAEEVLKAAELALSGARTTKGKKRDPEIEAKGASLFATVATLLMPPFFGLQEGFGRQYLRCLSFLSDLAQVEGPESAHSRLIALEALQAAARSDILYQTAGDFELQAEHLAPGLISNCHAVSTHDLRKLFNDSDADVRASRLPATLSARKPPTITSTSSPPSAHDLASIAVPTLRSLARLSDSSQLVSLHTSISTYLNRHRSGELWHGNSQTFVEWLASSLLSASTPSYRPSVVGWWVEQVGEIYDAEPQHKSVTLLYVLANLLRGKTLIHGLAVGGVLNTLAELLIRRARISSLNRPGGGGGHSTGSSIPSPTGTNTRPLSTFATEDPALAHHHHDNDALQDRDLLTRPILSTIAALSVRIYYVDQLDNLVSDLIDLLVQLNSRDGGLQKEDKVRGATKLIVAMRLLIEEAHRNDPATEGPGRRYEERSESTVMYRGGDEGRRSESRSRKSEDTTIGRPNLAPPIESEQTLKSNGLVLGPATTSTNGYTVPDESFALKSKKETTPNGPSIVVDDRPIAQPRNSINNRNRVSPRTFEKSLFLLTHGDPILRHEYVRTLVVYLERELDIEGIEEASTLSPDLAFLWKSLHSNAYLLATSPTPSSPSPLSSSLDVNSSDPTKLHHPLTRVRSHRSLRSSSIDSTNSSTRPTPRLQTTSLNGGASSPASAADYASISHLLSSVHRLRCASAVLEGIPMLLALDRSAVDWENGTDGRETSLERAQACREIVATTIIEVGRTWRIREVEDIGREALESLYPKVIPSFSVSPSSDETVPFTSRITSTTPSNLQHGTIVDALAFSDELQKATRLDRTSLASLLGASWTPEKPSRARSSSIVSPYGNGGSLAATRSILQLPLGGGGGGGTNSTARIVSNASTVTTGGVGGLAPTSPPRDGASSMRTPSLADLQASMSSSSISGHGGGGGISASSSMTGSRSVRATSNAPSMSSMNYNGRSTSSSFGGSEASPSKRRTSKISADSLLAQVGRRSQKGGGGSSQF